MQVMTFPCPSRAQVWQWRVQGMALTLAFYGLFLLIFMACQATWVQARQVLTEVSSFPSSLSVGLNALRFQPYAATASGKPLSRAEVAVMNVDKQDIPYALLNAGEDFMALVAQVESYSRHPYLDAAGWNIGFGYCISCRRGNGGDDRVIADLRAAGLSDSDITTLFEGPVEERKKVVITRRGAVRLLQRLAGESREAARKAIGDVFFDRLPKHRQAALSWLAYNTGAAGFSRFHRLRNAVQSGNSQEALKHLTPWFRGENGRSRPNRRAGNLLKTVYRHPEGLATVLASSTASTHRLSN